MCLRVSYKKKYETIIIISCILKVIKSLKKGVGSGSISQRYMDPRIRIHTKISWICNTG
jgi:hypothetical protein